MYTSSNTIKYTFAILLFIYFILIVQPWNLYFLNDDFVHIPLSEKTIWVHFQFFRPVANIITSVEVKLFGTNPVGFHITSILLHLIITYYVGILCKLLINKYGDPLKYRHAAYAAGCIFFIYPFHSEPIMWIIGRISMIATLFIILCIIFFLKRSKRVYFYSLSIAAFILALFSYEIAWVVPGFITLFTIIDHYKIKKDFRKNVLYVIPFWILLGLFLLVRYLMLQQLLTEYELLGRNMSLSSFIANFFRLFARTLAPPTENTVTFIALFLVLALCLFGLIIFIIKSKSIKTVHILLASFLVVSYIPTIPLGIDTHGSEGERYLYLPSVFWILLFTLCVFELRDQMCRIVFCGVMLIYAFLFASAAGNYKHASVVAKNILSLIPDQSRFKKLVAVNLPSNYKGAMIYRSGFKEAIQWIYPNSGIDSVIVIAAKRTYKKIILPFKTLEQDELPNDAIGSLKIDNVHHVLSFDNYSVTYNSKKDLLIFFNITGKGMILYPEP